jgi:hypothetical protein
MLGVLLAQGMPFYPTGRRVPPDPLLNIFQTGLSGFGIFTSALMALQWREERATVVEMRGRRVLARLARWRLPNRHSGGGGV